MWRGGLQTLTFGFELTRACLNKPSEGWTKGQRTESPWSMWKPSWPQKRGLRNRGLEAGPLGDSGSSHPLTYTAQQNPRLPESAGGLAH